MFCFCMTQPTPWTADTGNERRGSRTATQHVGPVGVRSGFKVYKHRARNMQAVAHRLRGDGGQNRTPDQRCNLNQRYE
jgi:hypothetical protein